MAFNYSPKISTDGLVLCLDAANTKSYPGSGTVWSDLSRGGNNGTLTNGPTFSSANGGSIVFDGIDDYVTRDSASFSLNANSGATMGCWVKVSIGETQAILLSHHQLNVNNGFRLQVYNGLLTYTLGGVADYSTSINISDNQWKYIVASSIGSTSLVYINGVLRSTISISSMIGVPNSYMIGKLGFTNTYYLSGSVSQVQIYNRALSSTEVLQNYNATKSRFGL
jgi:hypothetical protein